MAVIAMTQEMATLGKEVALGVCEALGLQQVRHEVGDVVAGRMQVKKSLIRRIREGKANPFEKWTADEKTISAFTNEEVLDLAVKGSVLIRGWGSTLLLRPVMHIPCVRVCAPLELRVQRLLVRLQSDDEKLARHEIEVDDAARAARMGEYFNVAWGDPALYDLTLNTERMPIPECVDIVVRLARSAAFQETAQSRRRLEELALEARVRSGLRADDATSAVDVSIEARGGAVTLRGIVAHQREKELALGVVGAISGVAEVRDELRTMTGGLYRFPSQPRD